MIPKAGLSMERHQEIGRELAIIRDRLIELSVEIGNAYPLNSPVGSAPPDKGGSLPCPSPAAPPSA